MRILFINNDGGGYADHIEVTEGTTVQELFSQRIRSGRAQEFLIRVNRQPVPSNQILREGDRISMEPIGEALGVRLHIDYALDSCADDVLRAVVAREGRGVKSTSADRDANPRRREDGFHLSMNRATELGQVHHSG